MISGNTAKLLLYGKEELLNEAKNQIISYKDEKLIITYFIGDANNFYPGMKKISDSEFDDLVDRYSKKELNELIGQQELTSSQHHSFILDHLLSNSMIKFVEKEIRDKQFQFYLLNNTYKTVRNFIVKNIENGIYIIPDIDNFMVSYLKSKKGHSLKQSYIMYKKSKITNKR